MRSILLILLLISSSTLADCIDYKDKVAGLLTLQIPDAEWVGHPDWRTAVVSAPKKYNGAELQGFELRSKKAPDLLAPLRIDEEPLFESFKKNNDYLYTHVTMSKELFDGQYCINIYYMVNTNEKYRMVGDSVILVLNQALKAQPPAAGTPQSGAP